MAIPQYNILYKYTVYRINKIPCARPQYSVQKACPAGHGRHIHVRGGVVIVQGEIDRMTSTVVVAGIDALQRANQFLARQVASRPLQPLHQNTRGDVTLETAESQIFIACYG